MAQPPAYNITTDFSATPGQDRIPAASLDVELQNLQTTIAALRTNIALIQRDDGALRDAIVTSASLSTGLLSDLIQQLSGYAPQAALVEVQTATEGQTAFTLTQATYTPGVNNLAVYVQGVRQFIGVDYAETSSSVVTFTSGQTAGTQVAFTIDERGVTGSAVSAANVTWAPVATGASATALSTLLADGGLARIFGVIPDGSTDCTTPLTNFLAWCIAEKRIAELPAGDIVISSTITITPPAHTENLSGRGGGFSVVGQGMYSTVLVFSGTGFCLDVTSNGDDLLFERFSVKSATGGGIQLSEGGNQVIRQFFMDGCGASYWGVKAVNGYQLSITDSRFWAYDSSYDGGAWYIEEGHTFYSHNCFISKQSKDGDIVYFKDVKNVFIPTITCESAPGTYTQQHYIVLDGSPNAVYIGTIHGETRCNKLIELASAGAGRGLRIEAIYAWQKRTDSGAKDFVILDATGAAHQVHIGYVFFKSDCPDAPTAPGYLILDDTDRVEIDTYSVDTNTTDPNQYNRALKANQYHRENEGVATFNGPTTTPTTTFDLGRAGVYLVSVCVSDNGVNHAKWGTWRVAFSDGSVTDITSVQEVGTQQSIGSGVGDITPTVDKDGVVTVTTASSTSRTYRITYGWEKILTLPWS